MRLGVALSWHVHPWEDLLALVRLAEARGYDAVLVDGDVSMLDVRSEADVLDGWTVTTALVAHTERIAVGSIRLVHHWNAAKLAQAAATLERIAPGRLHLLLAAGDRPIDARFGLPLATVGERAARLEETLDALRALLVGETVTRGGRFVRLDGARVRPVPPQRPPLYVAARSRRMLEVVAAGADGWEVNLPPIPARVRAAASQLEQACREHGRDPAEIRRSMLVYARAGEPDRERALAEFRRFNPWFGRIPDAELAPVLVLGSPQACHEQLSAISRELGIETVFVDLSGVAASRAREQIEAMSKNFVDAGSSAT